jgi:hypothetical protein
MAGDSLRSKRNKVGVLGMAMVKKSKIETMKKNNILENTFP